MRRPRRPVSTPHPDGPLVLVSSDPAQIWLQPGKYTYSENKKTFVPKYKTTPFLAWAKQHRVAVVVDEVRPNGVGWLEYLFRVTNKNDGPDGKPGVIWHTRVRVCEPKREGFCEDIPLAGRPTWLPSGMTLDNYWGSPHVTPSWSELIPSLPSPEELGQGLENIAKTMIVWGTAGAVAYFALTRTRTK